MHINRGNPLTRSVSQRLAAKFVAFRRAEPALSDQPSRRAVMPFLREVLEAGPGRTCRACCCSICCAGRPGCAARLEWTGGCGAAAGIGRPGEPGPAVPPPAGVALDLTQGGAGRLPAWLVVVRRLRDGGRWTTGPEARMLWDVSRGAEGGSGLRTGGRGFVAEAHPRLAVRVFANDRRVATLRFTHGHARRRCIASQFRACAIAACRCLCLCFDIRHPLLAGESRTAGGWPAAGPAGPADETRAARMTRDRRSGGTRCPTGRCFLFDRMISSTIRSRARRWSSTCKAASISASRAPPPMPGTVLVERATEADLIDRIAAAYAAPRETIEAAGA